MRIFCGLYDKSAGGFFILERTMTEIKAATNCDIIRSIFVDLHCCQNFLLKTDRKPGGNGLSGVGVFRAYCAAVIFSGYNIYGNRCFAGNIAVSCNSTGTFS